MSHSSKRKEKQMLGLAVVFLSLLILSVIANVILINKKDSDGKAEQYEKEVESLKAQAESFQNQLQEESSKLESATNQLASYEAERASYEEQMSIQESEAAASGVRVEVEADKKIVFLTFDDGPSDLTPQFLSTLEQYGVHATFFVTYQPQHENIYKDIIAAGHAIQIHTASHDYDAVYASVDAYIADFEKCYNYVVEVTGTKPTYFRYPGGSTNSYGKSIVREIGREMRNRGFQFVDWNVSVGDGSAAATRDSIIEKIANESDGMRRVVMLAHDSGAKTETLAALPNVIEYYKNNGYEFRTISGNIDMSFAEFIDIDE